MDIGTDQRKLELFSTETTLLTADVFFKITFQSWRDMKIVLRWDNFYIFWKFAKF